MPTLSLSGGLLEIVVLLIVGGVPSMAMLVRAL